MKEKNLRLLQAVRFAAKNPTFDYAEMVVIEKIQHLARQHHKQCENSCNGYGTVKGQVYYNGAIDNYARRTFGMFVKSAYVKDDPDLDDVFDVEISRIEDAIGKTLSNANATVKGRLVWRADYQHAPRGQTIKLFYKNDRVLFGDL